MNLNFKTVLVIAVFSFAKSFAQVGIQGNNPDKSAVLDLNANNKGLLIPRISLASTSDITGIAGGNPAQSLLVYNTNGSITGTNAAGTGYYYWDVNIWKKMIVKDDIAISNDWALLGNAGTSPTTNFVGTTDVQDLVFKTGNKGAARITSTGNYTIGYGAGTAGTANVATVASSTSGSTTTQQNAVLTVEGGDVSINGLTVGKGGGQFPSNTVLGYQTLYNNKTGGLSNVAVGEQSMYSNTTGVSNVAVGRQSLFANAIGSGNSGSGLRALYSNTTGSYNVANGFNSLYQNTIGSNNTAIGNSSLYSFTVGDNNVALGNKAGYFQNSGSYNIVIGSVPDSDGLNLTNKSGSNQLNIGNTIFGTGINSNTVGAGNIGIGTAAPGTKLEVNNGTTAGAIKIVDGTQGVGKVLTSDADGVGTWISGYQRPATPQALSAGTGTFTLNMSTGGQKYSIPGLKTITVTQAGLYNVSWDCNSFGTITGRYLVMLDCPANSFSEYMGDFIDDAYSNRRRSSRMTLYLLPGTYTFTLYADTTGSLSVTGYAFNVAIRSL
ncbi:autotransporter outer membrane beta-barrel domain-containing protein [Flavobacterium gilvum]|uniref:YapH protein n=1 Tax=Flavobacterium gilvum TaxID=1492737 RepID=A0AAC9I6K0_9FLAO|nr:hypothetical protein [Flavobacterium gilvum]AOW09563.1 hypothetical protein EM308_08640 [Flavobacterium gilvum]